MQCESLRIKVSRHLISRDSLNNCVLIETKYSPIIEEIKAQVQMLLFIYPFLVVIRRFSPLLEPFPLASARSSK